MRKRVALGAAITGALALTAVIAPAAQADDKYGNISVSGVSVNGGKAIVLGSTAKKTVKLSFTVTDNSGVKMATGYLFHGKNIDTADSAVLPSKDPFTCKKVTSTKSTCSANFTFTPGSNAINKVAGTWKTWLIAQAKDNNYVQKDNARSFKVLRASQLAGTNAAPEPVKKGATVTVTSKLTRANWDTGVNGGFGGQPVVLQFKAKNASSYKTVKTVKSSSTGALSTTVKAGVDGSYRYVFAGTAATAASNAAGDFIDVK
ncbi:calcium-binding protein [Streptomyces sp. CA-210063]|uniref:calcium-binding protein n=1 Tax=Streptomyces sp. CA-210063 TaxID=2801029 RepID=UPI00214B64C0|nr:calcium-binding protein [Streptomyces sp. CA-210063]UUU33033.1 calcium-binding protein [Streptomyces sp. CA-210063]